MSNFLDQVGVALIKFAEAYSTKTKAMMLNAEINQAATEYNMAKDREQTELNRQKYKPVSNTPEEYAAVLTKAPTPTTPLAPTDPGPVQELEEPEIAEGIVKPVEQMTKEEVKDELYEREVIVKKGSRETTLRRLLIEARAKEANAVPAPVEEDSNAGTTETIVVTEELTRAYLKPYMEKNGQEKTTEMILKVTGHDKLSLVKADEKVSEHFANLIAACKADGITVEEGA
jgi:hypothetical protein